MSARQELIDLQEQLQNASADPGIIAAVLQAVISILITKVVE